MDLKSELYKVMFALHIPIFIQDDFMENFNFYPESRIVKMLSWNYDDFIFWYENNL